MELILNQNECIVVRPKGSNMGAIAILQNIDGDILNKTDADREKIIGRDKNDNNNT